MSVVLALLHTNEKGEIGKSSLEVLDRALALSEEDLSEGGLEVGVVGSDAVAATRKIAGCGAERFLAVEGESVAQARYATDAAAATALVREVDASLVLAPGTSRWNRALPGAAYRTEGAIDTHVCEVSGGERVQVTRWFYRQRMKAVLTREQRPWYILIDPGVGTPWSGEAGSVEVEKLTVEPSEDSRTEVVAVREPAASEQTIQPDAPLLFVAGAGWTKRQADGQVHVDEAEELIRTFLDRSQASLGGSKSMVDLSSEGQRVLSFMTHLNQIGQTGSSPRHRKGLATCCHGEEPHVVGWRFISERRAINTDPNCGWAQGKADVLYVADAFAVMRKVVEMLS